MPTERLARAARAVRHRSSLARRSRVAGARASDMEPVTAIVLLCSLAAAKVSVGGALLYAYGERCWGGRDARAIDDGSAIELVSGENKEKSA